jgi:hypothetical protein
MQQLHIVSFDIPYPPDYGGSIDVFYKLKALHERGIEITLHCFQYGGKEQQPGLLEICKEVFYYQRNTGWKGIHPTLPYIVYSRINDQLLERLVTATHILFEGLHTCYYLNHPLLAQTFKMVRCHNVEHEYYEQLAVQSPYPKKIYHRIESKHLKNYESVLENAQVLFAISEMDFKYFKQQFPNNKVIHLPAFHGNVWNDNNVPTKSYALYHGSLQIPENEHAALFLVEQVFARINYPLIVAGSNPGRRLIQAMDALDHVTLVANPTGKQLEHLITQAHVHLMYATQQTGLKLKLLKSLFTTAHVIANKKMATDIQLINCLTIADSPKDWVQKIKALSTSKPLKSLIEKRSEIMENYQDHVIINRLLENANFTK